MARAAFRQNMMMRPTLVEIDIGALDPDAFVPCPIMMDQGEVVCRSRGVEFMHERGLYCDQVNNPFACLNAFGVVIYKGIIPPEAFIGAVRLLEPGHSAFTPLNEMVGSLTSYPTVRRYMKPIHDWIVDGASYPIPLAQTHDRALLGDDCCG